MFYKLFLDKLLIHIKIETCLIVRFFSSNCWHPKNIVINSSKKTLFIFISNVFEIVTRAKFWYKSNSLNFQRFSYFCHLRFSFTQLVCVCVYLKCEEKSLNFLANKFAEAWEKKCSLCCFHFLYFGTIFFFSEVIKVSQK